MRSKLFVPGTRTELFAKALAGKADGISLDLEDSVVDAGKEDARRNVADFLRSPDVADSRKVIIVRSNALDSPHFAADIQAVALPALAMLNLPKVESADEVRAAVAVLERAEKANGVTRAIGLLVNIETPKGLRQAAEIGAAHPRVAGLQLALNDLFEGLGMNRHDRDNVHGAMFAVRLAAGETGISAYDGAFADIQDLQGFRAEAEMARRLGYDGKSCIHPDQIALANDIFSHSDLEISHARRVLAAAREAEAKGRGAFTLDGKMIDRPMIRRAKAVVATSQHTNTNIQ